MHRYFAYSYDGPAFELFGPGHLTALGIVAAIVACLIWGWRNPTEAGKRHARRLLVGAILAVEIAYLTWLVRSGVWDVQTHLPLHACSLSIWGSIYILLARSYRAYEVIYFIGIAGAAQGLLTPSAGEFGLPHFRAIQTLSSHSLIIISMVYMSTIEGFRPTWMSVWKSMLFVNLFMFAVTGVNLLIGSNYMYTLRKPATASLFDVMGPWPWYLVLAEFLALALFALLYLPFAISNRWAKQPATVSR